MAFISLVVNTYNEEAMISRCLDSVKDWVDEIVVVDMHSDDRTVEICREFTDNIYCFERTGYVEPAREFAVSKATGDWILVLDADERMTPRLGKMLRDLTERPDAPDVYELPMRHIVFGRWIKHSALTAVPGYSYHRRLFKKGAIKYSSLVHSIPEALGSICRLPAEEDLALVHRSPATVDIFVEKMGRYTTAEANALWEQGVVFRTHMLLTAPLGGFYYRFWKGRAFRDGMHGIVFSGLMSLYRLLVCLKLWDRCQNPSAFGPDVPIDYQYGGLTHV